MRQKCPDLSTKRAILASSLKLFTERGFYGTTIKDISKSAKVSVGAVYRYFNSKEEIAQLLFDEAVSLFKLALVDSTKSADTAEIFVIRTVKTILIFSEKNLRISKYLWLCRHDEFLKEITAKPSVLRYDEFGKRFSLIINSARRSKLIQPYSAALIWTLVFGTPLSYVRDWLDGIVKHPPSSVSVDLGEAVWNALQGKY